MARNQCDGCQRGLPVQNGCHYESDGRIYQGCTAGKYTETKMVAVTFHADGRRGTVFAQVPRTADGKVVLSGDAFQRLCQQALGVSLERGTTVSYG